MRVEAVRQLNQWASVQQKNFFALKFVLWLALSHNTSAGTLTPCRCKPSLRDETRWSCCGLLFLSAARCPFLQGGGGSLQGTAHRLLQPAPSCPERRSPPITSTEPGESQPGARAADLGDRSDRGPVRAHRRSTSCSLPFSPTGGVRGSPPIVQAAARVQQPDAADGRVPPAGSTGWRHTLTAAWGRESVSTCPQPMSLHDVLQVCPPVYRLNGILFRGESHDPKTRSHSAANLTVQL